MTYTKKTAEENDQMETLAKELLSDKTNSQLDVILAIEAQFPDVKRSRIVCRVTKALRILQGEKVRSRGGNRPGAGRPPLPEELRREKTSFTLVPETKKLIRDIAESEGLSNSKVIDKAIKLLAEKYT
jgi:hypothetical protein